MCDVYVLESTGLRVCGVDPAEEIGGDGSFVALKGRRTNVKGV